MTRSVEEWIGKTDDAKIPPRVRARVFAKFGGICQLSKREIRAGERWECDHIIALVNGGEHRESNLHPVLVGPHREKTKADVAEKARVAKIRARHIGAVRPKGTIKSAGFPRAPKRREIGEKEMQLRALRERNAGE
jgi:5-methylcytosine-specific restriction enzyme A